LFAGSSYDKRALAEVGPAAGEVDRECAARRSRQRRFRSNLRPRSSSVTRAAASRYSLPEESFEYFERLQPAKEGASLPEPRAAIVSVASGYERESSERDPHPQRAFDARQPPFDATFDRGERRVEDTEFHTLATRVFEPFLAAAELEVR
jgi:hypothetical protein